MTHFPNAVNWYVGQMLWLEQMQRPVVGTLAVAYTNCSATPLVKLRSGYLRPTSLRGQNWSTR